MNNRRSLLTSAALLALPLAARAAVDGAVTPLEFNLTLANQTNATGFGNNQSELNQALARVNTDGSLQFMLTGNLEGTPFSNGMVIFIDARAGGGIASTSAGGYGIFGSIGGAKSDDWGTDTNGDVPVDPPPGGPSVVGQGFNPEISFEMNDNGQVNYFLNVIDMTVPNEPNPNRDVFLPDVLDTSRSGVINGPAVTSTYFRDGGATNAGDVTSAFNNTNILGVNGTGDPGGVGDPSTALTGFEALFSTLFLNADPGQEIKLLAFITNDQGNYLSNQFLPGLPASTGNLETAGGAGGTPLFDAEAGFAAPLGAFHMTVPFPEWGNTGGGSWSVDANWQVVRPEGINTTAKFGSAITANSTVNVDGAHTVGAVIFDNDPFSYTLGGTGSLTFDALPGKTTRIISNSGNHTIAVPQTWLKNMRISVASDMISLSGQVTAAAGVSLTKDGAGTAQMKNIRVDALSVAQGALQVAPSAVANDPAATSIVKSYSIAAGATLHLTNNSMIVDYTGPVGSLVNDTRLHLQSNRLTGTPTGLLRQLGYGDNAVLGKSTFAGQTVDASSLLIKYTWTGDVNLDGQVDITDLGALATNWQTNGPWTSGDFDYNGFVDITDLGGLATNWQFGVGNPMGPDFNTALASVGLGGASVPEPALASLLAATLVARRPRRRA